MGEACEARAVGFAGAVWPMHGAVEGRKLGDPPTAPSLLPPVSCRLLPLVKPTWKPEGQGSHRHSPQRPASWARAGWEGVESGSGGASKEIVHAAHCFTLLSFVWVKKPHWPPYYRRIMSTKSHPHLDPKMLTSFVHMRMWRTRGERNSHLP